jgi:hypothetical protein
MVKAREATAKATVIVNYKGSADVAEWLKGLADHVNLPVTNVLDLALMEFSKSREYRPMPRRQARRGRPKSGG